MDSSHQDLGKICDDILALPPLEPGDSRSNFDVFLNELMECPERLENYGFESHDNEGQWAGSYTNSELQLAEIDHINATVVSSRPTSGFGGVSTPTSLPSEVSTAGQDNPRTRKSKRLSRDAVKILKSWFHEHQDNPYPTDQGKLDLQQRTGLDRSQISNWFINARRRKKITAEPTPKPGTFENSFLSPLERWQNSPPESEAAATSDIMRALEDTTLSSDGSSIHSRGWKGLSSNESSRANSNPIDPASASSLDQSQSSGSELSFSAPQRSSRPPTPILKPRRRRRWKRPISMSKRKPQRNRIFQCTFCSDAFATRYDWQRHEKALHLPVDQWSCAPNGGVTEIDGVKVCVFCFAPDVDLKHLEIHNYLACRERPTEQRTFSRKDHLRQHLKFTHNVDFHPFMDQWRDSKKNILSRCGFCNTKFTTWEDRIDHVAEHFRKGADMLQWTGDWGFEPDIEKLVENAMPPYLLGQERYSLDPWKTSDALGILVDEEPPFSPSVPNGLDRYANLQRDLVSYIRNQVAEGIYPSDQMIQDHARQIAYGSDDRWNQTYADNPIWLNVIKLDAGL